MLISAEDKVAGCVCARASSPAGRRWSCRAGRRPPGRRNRLVDRQARALVVARATAQAAVVPEDALALAEQRVAGVRRRPAAASSRARPPTAVTRRLTISIGSRKAWPYSCSWQAVELLERRRRRTAPPGTRPAARSPGRRSGSRARARPRSRRRRRRRRAGARAVSAAAARSPSSRASSIEPSIMKTVRIWSYLRSLVSRPIAEVIPG